MIQPDSRLNRRGGALYVIVLFTALIVSVLGLASLTIVRVERTRANVVDARLIARSNARSAVEYALLVIANDSGWRSTYTNGIETTPQAIGPTGTGTVSWILDDSDGDLSNGDTDLRLKGIGRVGNVVQVSSIQLTTSGNPLNCLEVAVCCGGDASFSNNSVVTTDQILHSNGSVSNSGDVHSDVEAVGLITGSQYFGVNTSPVPPRDLPNSSVFDYYISNGTAIDYTSLPNAGPAKQIMDVVLSPNNNPFGSTNPQGIYVIDCQGGLFRIKYSRVIGTLVLTNLNPLSDIDDSLSMESAVANYPTLLVQGGVEFRLSANVLSESNRGMNFNPPGSPYLGLSDSDTSDSYPSQIKGLVYVSGNASVKINDTVIDGVFVVGGQLNVTIGETLTVTNDPQFFSNPPPGFSFGNEIVVTPRSWIWDTAP